MINIKTYTKPKKGEGTSGGGGTTNITNVTNNNVANEWFYYDQDYDAVCCKYNFYSVGAVSANGPDDTSAATGLTASEIDKLKLLASKMTVDQNNNITIIAYITAP